jgi:hypothetical protein
VGDKPKDNEMDGTSQIRVKSWSADEEDNRDSSFSVD